MATKKKAKAEEPEQVPDVELPPEPDPDDLPTGARSHPPEPEQ